jgi:hypothetical protein
MSSTQHILKEAESLPVEDRAFLADSILKTLNAPVKEIDREWVKAAKQRLSEIHSGKVVPVSGIDVFEKVRKRFGK